MTSTGTTPTADRCPACGAKGRAVPARTVESLASGEARDRVGRSDGFRFCAEAACDIVYFRSEPPARILRHEVRVRIGQKENAAPRPVCYCFDHTVEEIEAEVARRGDSTVADEITDLCRRGLARCEETNPQGSCCLGNVRAWVRAARARRAPGASGPQPRNDVRDCCASPSPPRGPDTAHGAPARGAKAGLWTSAGAVLSAAFSSACCWLPLLLVAFGASAAGVAGFVEAYRPWFLGATALLLGSGFYFAYLRKAACAPGRTCSVPNARLARVQRCMLWVATAFALAFALFPTYAGHLLGGAPEAGGGVPRDPAADVRAYRIDGMTCEACAATLRHRLAAVPGVARAEVDYRKRSARIVLERGGNGEVEGAVLRAIRDAGYRAERTR